jgi:hypothetical protein
MDEDDDDEDCCKTDQILDGMRRNKHFQVRTIVSRLGNKYEFPLIQTRVPRRILPTFPECERLPDLSETVDEYSTSYENENHPPVSVDKKKFCCSSKKID